MTIKVGDKIATAGNGYWAGKEFMVTQLDKRGVWVDGGLIGSVFFKWSELE